MPSIRIVEPETEDIARSAVGATFNPDEFRQKALTAGYDPRVVEEEVQRRLAIQQAPQAITSGALTPQQALEVVGGLGAPGSEDILTAINQQGDTVGTSEQQFKTQQALRAVDELEQLFGRGDKTNVGTGEDLSLAKSATTFGKGAARVGAFGKSLFDSEFQEDVNKFKAQLNQSVGILTQAFGSGTPQEAEAKRLIESAPRPLSTDEEAKQWFKSARKLLGEVSEIDSPEVKVAKSAIAEPQLDTLKQLESEGVLTLNPITEEPKKKEGDSIARRVARTAADVAPVAGGIVGGFTGGLAGLPAAVPTLGGSSVAGGAAGAAIGTGAGAAFQNMVEDLLGEQDEAPSDQVASAVKQAAVAGATDLAFGAGFKAISKGGNLVLKTLGKGVDDIPLRSIRTAPSDLRNFSKKHNQDLAEFLVNKKILGENAIEVAESQADELQQSFDALAMNRNIEIPVDKLKTRFAEELRSLAGVTDEGLKTKITPKFNKKIAKDVLAEWENISNQLDLMGTDTVTPAQLTELRRAIDEVIPDSQFIDPSVKNVAVRVRKIANDVVRESVDERLLTDVAGEGTRGSLKELGQELSKFYDFLEIAEKRSGKGRGTLMANLTRLGTTGIGGGIGASVGGVPGAVVGGGIGLTSEALLRDPEVLRMLYQMGVLGQIAGPAVRASGRALQGVVPPSIATIAAQSIE